MEITFVQLTKEELTSIINEAVKAAFQAKGEEPGKEPFIKGIHELAKFLGVSPARAQKLKNEGVFPYFQDGRLVLFDPFKVKMAMESHAKSQG